MHLLVIKLSQKSSFWPNEKFGWYLCNALSLPPPLWSCVDEDGCISVIDAIEEVPDGELKSISVKN